MFLAGSSSGTVVLITLKTYTIDSYHLIEALLRSSNGFHSVVCLLFIGISGRRTAGISVYWFFCQDNKRIGRSTVSVKMLL